MELEMKTCLSPPPPLRLYARMWTEAHIYMAQAHTHCISTARVHKQMFCCRAA